MLTYHSLLHDQARLQLSRTPRTLPSLQIMRKPSSIEDYCFDDFVIFGYDPYQNIKAAISK
ncbi:thymidylate synthase [mine drainage metagenome]|uniref:Thymidylate synthase n=2 Tax=mine drainage metagenome TaxID=410659 RepID=T0ZLD0_9ZZZZ